MSAPTERDREMARVWLKAMGGGVSAWSLSMLAELLADVRREGEARALAALREWLPLIPHRQSCIQRRPWLSDTANPACNCGRAALSVDEAERALAKGQADHG